MAPQGPPQSLDGFNDGFGLAPVAPVAPAAPAAPPQLLQQAQPYAAPALPKTPRILACVLCQHRKIRCDRNFPCANCTKANVKCTPSTPAPARKRRRPNQDLQERLARCEELLKEYATDRPEDASQPRSASRSSEDDQHSSWQPTAKLVEIDGSVRFMDSLLLGTIYDELRAMREIVDAGDDERTTETSPESSTPDENSELALGPDSPDQNVEDFWPSVSNVFRLWQIFIDRVHPLTKIVHIPTLQPYVAEAMSGSHNVPKNIEALLFSIFLMATIALTPEECRTLLGCSREDALCKFGTGMRLTLVRMNFLKNNDLPTLQALVFFTKSLQGRYNRHAAWVLNGIMVRLAQKMGVHRDGEILGLGPFETEMRRRLWWQIIMIESKSLMVSGMSHTLLPQGDAKTPTNVNDADMHPSATEPFQDRDGPTEMIFVVVLSKVSQFLMNTPGAEMTFLAAEMDGVPGGPSMEQVTEARRAVKILANEMLDILDRWCDPSAGPVHALAMEMRGQIHTRLAMIDQKPNQQPDGEVRTMKDNAFKIAVDCLEHNEQFYPIARKLGFLWFARQHFQLEMFTYMCGQLCPRTEGALVDRAWQQVGVVYTYHAELFEVARNRMHSTLGQFVLKAWRCREQALIARTGAVPETPFYIERLRAALPHADCRLEEPTPSDGPAANGSRPYTPSVSTRPSIGTVPGSGTSNGGDFVMVSPDVNSGFQNLTVDGGQKVEPALDHFFTGYMDTSALEWDMFGDMGMNGGADTGATIPPAILTGLTDWYRG